MNVVFFKLLENIIFDPYVFLDPSHTTKYCLVRLNDGFIKIYGWIKVWEQYGNNYIGNKYTIQLRYKGG